MEGALLILRAYRLPTEVTTLIVSLALLQKPLEIAMLMIGVVIMTVIAWAINHALWSTDAGLVGRVMSAGRVGAHTEE